MVNEILQADNLSLDQRKKLLEETYQQKLEERKAKRYKDKMIFEWKYYYDQMHKAARVLNSAAVIPNSPTCVSSYYLYQISIEYFMLNDSPDSTLPKDIPEINEEIIDQEFYRKCESLLERFHDKNSMMLMEQELEGIDDEGTRMKIIRRHMQEASAALTSVNELYMKEIMQLKWVLIAAKIE